MSIILFDMDGTLLDTERLYCKAWRMAAEELGFHMTEEQSYCMRSLGKPYAYPFVKQMLGEDADVEVIRARRVEIMKPWFEEGIPLKPHVFEVLEELRNRGHKLAIVTASNKDRTQLLMTRTGLGKMFDDFIYASMVERGKPSPDVYIYACEQMQVYPEDAYAIEDSPNGVRSAHDAGCKTILIPDLTEPDEEQLGMLYAKADGLMDLLHIIR